MHKLGKAYAESLRARREESRQMIRRFLRLAEVIVANGGEVSFEWPQHCTGWLQSELLDFITRFNLYSVVVHGCALGMTNVAGEPILKKWRFVTTSARMAAALEPLTCQHEKRFKHGEISGATTAKTAVYPMALFHTILSSLYGYM